MSDFKVVHLGEGRLQVIDPPIYWVGGLLLVVGLLGLLVLGGWVVARMGTRSRSVGVPSAGAGLGRGWGVPLVGLVLAVVGCYGTWMSMQTSVLVLDREQARFRLDYGRRFFTRLADEGDLATVRYAALETDTGANRFVLVMSDGKRVSLGSFTSQDGQSEAVEAVNDFLGVKEDQ